MREPLPSEEYVIIVDNKGRERVQRVEYVVLDVRGEKKKGYDSKKAAQVPVPGARNA